MTDEGLKNKVSGAPRDGYFGYPEGANLFFEDEDGNRLTREEFRERVRRKAEERRRTPRDR